jgi:hypothetical protein
VPEAAAMRDEDGLRERLVTARARLRPTSYAPVLPRQARGEPALPAERRARPRAVRIPRGLLVDLVG